MCCSGVARKVIVIFLFVFALAVPVMAETPQPVRTVGGAIDYAGILLPEEKRDLEIAAGQLARRIDTDFFIVTVDDRAGQWAELRSHYAMVSRVFGDVEKAVVKHFGREAPLTLLMVFKSSVVLHLKTSRADIEEHLLFRNYYRGANGAFERIRGRDERHAAAALRYLDSFERTLDTIATETGSTAGGFAVQAERARFWLFQRYALLSTRELLQHPWLDPLYRAFCLIVGAVTSFPLLPGWISFLLLMSGLYLALHAVSLRLESKYGDFGEFAGDVLQAAAFSLPLMLLFAVSQGDLENLLYISQRFGGEVVTYLNWSNEITTRSFAIPFWVIGVSAAAVGLLEFFARLKKFWTALDWTFQSKVSASGRQPRWLTSILRALAIPGYFVSMVAHTISGVGWVMSLVIWPGLVAAFFLAVSVAKRVMDFVGAYWLRSDEAPPAMKMRPLPAPIFSSGGSL